MKLIALPLVLACTGVLQHKDCNGAPTWVETEHEFVVRTGTDSVVVQCGREITLDHRYREERCYYITNLDDTEVFRICDVKSFSADVSVPAENPEGE